MDHHIEPGSAPRSTSAVTLHDPETLRLRALLTKVADAVHREDYLEANRLLVAFRSPR